MSARRRLLFIQTNGLGNVIMSLGMIREIRERHPEVQFDMLCAGPMIQALLAPENLFDNYYYFRRPKSLGGLWQVLKLLVRLFWHYDDCIVGWRMSPRKGGLLAPWTGARRRIGNWRGRPVRAYTQQIEYVMTIHENDAHLKMAAFLFDDLTPNALPVLRPSAEEIGRARELRAQYGAASGPVVGMHPGCDAVSKVKRWPAERFAEVARRFNAAHPDAHVWVFLGPDEMELAPAFEGLERVRIVQHKEIRLILALVAQCDVMINSDSGLGHMSAAAGVPTIDILGPENENSCRAYGPHVRTITDAGLECRPCVSRAVANACPHRNCLMHISTDRILGELEQVLAPAAPASLRPLPVA